MSYILIKILNIINIVLEMHSLDEWVFLSQSTYIVKMNST